jgi:large subunit ribosomal protein L21
MSDVFSRSLTLTLTLLNRRTSVHAIIQTGGKQYQISPGDTLRVEKIIGQKGDQIELPRVLYYSEGEQVLVGSPYLANVKVVGEILDQRRAKKIIVFKMKRRKGYHKRQGHRQSFTTLRIKEITVQ